MVYNRYRVQMAVRVALLALSVAAAVALFCLGRYPITAGLLAVAAVLEAFFLFRYLERTERDVARFFESVAYDAFELTAGPQATPTAARLHTAFARIIHDFRKVRAEREEHYQYLQTVIRHVGTGLIAFDAGGRVDLCNQAALRMFALDALQHLRQLEPCGADFVNALRDIRPDERQTVRAQGPGGPMVLALHAARFRRSGTDYTLVSLQNISEELEEKEMEAWQSILRAMTHEIRNSMTPIGSLASTTLQLLETPQQLAADSATAEDARLALRTIERRSQSLLRFVDAFRTLAHLPVPVKEQVRMADLVEHLQTFFQAPFAQRQVRAEFCVTPPDLVLLADPALLEQVLINLILNALEALEGRPDAAIRMAAARDEWGHVRITVTDNGPGIPEAVKDKAFIPFFSTKPAGSGMGLSLSRLILRLHGAGIHFTSVPDAQTTFEIVFPAGTR